MEALPEMKEIHPRRDRARPAAAGIEGVSVRPLKPLIAALSQAGVDVVGLLTELSIAPDSVFEAEGRIALPAMLAIWRRAEEVLGDPDVGLRALGFLTRPVFEMIRFETEYLVVQAMITSPCVDLALRRLARYFPIGFGAIGLAVGEHPGGAAVQLIHPPGAPLPRGLVQYVLGLPLTGLRYLTQDRLVPLELHLRYSADAASAAAHAARFGAAPRFAAACDGFIVSAAHLALPLTTRDDKAAAVIETKATRLLRTLGTVPWSAQVRLCIDRGFADSMPSLDDVAARLGVGVRTLSRSLRGEQTSFRAILDEVRRLRARYYLLQRPELSFAEIGQLLGYGEETSFQRSVRRWFGCSPGTYRLRERPSG